MLKDAGYAGLGEHADDLIVHVEELSAQLALRLTTAGDAHQHKGPFLQEHHGVPL